MWKYDAENFDPAAPVIEVRAQLGQGRPVGILMQVDTGADLSCIPASLARSATGRLSYGWIYVAGYDGRVEKRRTYHVNFRFGEHHFRGVEALAIQSEVGLIGRDVLNRLDVSLLGPDLKILLNGK